MGRAIQQSSNLEMTSGAGDLNAIVAKLIQSVRDVADKFDRDMKAKTDLFRSEVDAMVASARRDLDALLSTAEKDAGDVMSKVPVLKMLEEGEPIVQEHTCPFIGCCPTEYQPRYNN